MSGGTGESPPPPPPVRTRHGMRVEGAGSVRLAMLLTLAFPGLGQAMQKRWLAAVAYAASVLAALAYFIWQFVCLMRALWRLADFDAPVAAAPGFGRLALGLALCLAVYAAALVDTWVAGRRRARSL